MDYTETFRRDGSIVVWLRAPLPKGAFYRIEIAADGAVTSTAQSGESVHGRRHFRHATYQAALDHGVRWARRKINAPDRLT